MHEDLGPASEVYETVRSCRVSGNDNGPAGTVKPVGERRCHEWMVDQSGGHLYIFVLHHQPALLEFMSMYEWTERRPSLVLDPRANVVAVHLEEQLRHPHERRRSPGVNPRREPRGPREPEQVAVVGVVVGMLVSDEDVSQLEQ